MTTLIVFMSIRMSSQSDQFNTYHDIKLHPDIIIDVIPAAHLPETGYSRPDQLVIVGELL